jgi:hypothetical protein
VEFLKKLRVPLWRRKELQEVRLLDQLVHRFSLCQPLIGHLNWIGDVAWRQFTTYTESKAAEAGSVVVMVAPTHTAQACSRCGARVTKELKDRVHSCTCGLGIDRDENAYTYSDVG